jgi:hypothetical protein
MEDLEAHVDQPLVLELLDHLSGVSLTVRPILPEPEVGLEDTLTSDALKVGLFVSHLLLALRHFLIGLQSPKDLKTKPMDIKFKARIFQNFSFLFQESSLSKT